MNLTIFEGTKGFVKKAFMNVLAQGGIRIEMDIIITDKHTNKSLNVGLEYIDPNWNESTTGFIGNPKFYDEKEKYKVLNPAIDTLNNDALTLTSQEKEMLLNQIFDICSGEMLFYRSFIEDLMFKFFKDVNDDTNLTDKEFDLLFGEENLF